MRLLSVKKLFLIVISAILVIILFAVAILIMALDNPVYDEIEKEIIIGNRVEKETVRRPILNFHSLLDKAVFGTGNFFNSDKAYFRNGIKSRGFKEHLDAVHVEIPNKIGEGLYELDAETLEGNMHPAFRVYHWYADTAPTIIYNHGASQYPFDAIFVSIFDREIIERPLKVNLIVVRTPFHRKGRLELNEGASTLSRFLAIMAVSVRLTEKLVQSVKRKGSRTVVVTGVSLGGFVANRHHVVYNTAAFYVPVIAGTAFGEIHLITAKADPLALRNPEIIRKHLNFTNQWLNMNNNNVYPILARYDDICRLEHQGPSYGNSQVEVWNRGHITTALSVRALRVAFLRHVLSEQELDPFK